MSASLSRRTVVSRVDRLRGRSAGDVLTAVRHRAHYDCESYGLVRDLEVPFEPPEARIPLQVRPLTAADVPRILDPAAAGLDEQERAERRSRMAMLHSDLGAPWVAVTDGDDPAYVQWLIGPTENEQMLSYFCGLFPRLADDEALLEGAYTSSAHRGKRVMPWAMARIAEQAVGLGVRRVLTFVSVDNAASLVGCRRAGFTPTMTRHEAWRGFRRSITFGPPPPETLEAVE